MFERFTDQARNVVVDAQGEARELGHGWIGTEHLLLALLARPEVPGVATLTRIGVTAAACREAVAAIIGRAGGGLDDDDAEALRGLGIDLDEVRRRAEETFGKGALDRPSDPGATGSAGNAEHAASGAADAGGGEAEAGGGAGARDPGVQDLGEESRLFRLRRRVRSADRPSGHIPFTARAKKALELSLREAIALKHKRIGTEHLLLGLLRCEDHVTADLLRRLQIGRRTIRQQIIVDLNKAA